MKILAIETSCDETAIALLDIDGPLKKPNIKILANTLLSQAKLHEAYGGVYPNLAKREHQKNLPILLDQVLLQARSLELEASDIDCIAVTEGPGLEPALWTGIVFAEDLAKKWVKPLVGINHMEGHILSILPDLKERESLELPALALLVSGGHTELVYMKDFGEYEVIGRTRDDAVGEAFDKVARMLGLTYPGGPEISKRAELARGKGREDSIELPRPMIHSKDFDFSFSGLKTSVLYKVKEVEELSPEFIEDMSRAFEDAAVETLVEKTRRALNKFDEVKTLIVGGGVSANKFLTQCLEKMIQEFQDKSLKIALRDLSTDNAVMIGLVAYSKLTKNPNLDEKEIKARGNLSFSSQNL